MVLGRRDGGPLIATNASGLDGNSRAGWRAIAESRAVFLRGDAQLAVRVGEFSVEIIDVSRVIDELEPGTRNRHACERRVHVVVVVGRW